MNGQKNRKILIVEDEDSLRQVLADALTQAGFDVSQAEDGQTGLLEAINGKPDLIFLDILMPRMDGRAAYKKLREDDAIKDIPVIFLTNLSELDTVSSVIKDGNADYIVKSDWSIDDIVKKAKEKLGTV